MLLDTLLQPTGDKRIRLFDDKVFVDMLNFKREAVLLVGETGSQKAVSISAEFRPTLTDLLFSSSSINNTTSDTSQVYVLRKNNSDYLAYHLDVSNPARITLASKFEMRPDDIVFVATQPLTLYSRALSQILGSTSLTLQARDTARSELE